MPASEQTHGTHRTTRNRRRTTDPSLLLARAGLTSFASTLFAYPEKRPDFTAARRAAALLEGKLTTDIARLQETWAATECSELQSQWLRLFSLTPLCPPYETALCDDALRKGAVLADVAGFYRAFGLRPAGDMADHIASELGFAAYLLTKLAYAEAHGWDERADITGNAFARFLSEHLGPFAGRFFPRTEAAGVPFYRDAARLGQHVMRELRCAVKVRGISANPTTGRD